ncbi:aminoacetone oxidase family FAD-binding enzyme [Planctomycetota bacterium]|nr:aminoacetone oxidase family FAD-binding enzyme [Planctomycetota bacterium]
MTNHFEVIIVGAGLSGLACAFEAAKGGCGVLLLEREDFPARKFTHSSMGKAAISNTGISPDHFHGRDARFVSDALAAFDVTEFSETSGLPIHAHEYYGLQLCGDNPTDIIVWLTEAFMQAGGEISTSTRVAEVGRMTDGFQVKLDGGDSLTCERLVLACSGPNLPQLGGTMLGTDAASHLDHTVRAPLPAQVGLVVKEEWVAKVAGCWMDVSLKLRDGKKTVIEKTGSVLFTQSGLVGPAIYHVAADAANLLRYDKTPMLEINFFPERTHDELAVWMHQVFGERTKERAVEALDVMLPAKLGAPMLKRMKLKAHARVMQLEKSQRETLLSDMHACEFTITSTLGIKAAESFSGGVAVREIDPRTFLSKACEGLYVVGSLLDVDADWGGFAQHFALGSGMLAGQSLAEWHESR